MSVAQATDRSGKLRQIDDELTSERGKVPISESRKCDIVNGVNMKSKVKSQHHVPRMYLKRFSDDGEHIDVWNIQNDAIIPHQKPKGYAAKNHFYDTDDAALKSALAEMEEYYKVDFTPEINADEQFVEHGLARSEGEIASIFRDIDANHSLLHRETIRSKLTIFIHDLAYRTEAFRDQMDAIHDITEAALIQMNLDPEKFGKLHTGQEIQLHQILGITPVLKTAAQLENNYSWHFTTINGLQNFIISDNPAVGVAFGFNDICFPLSSKTAIIFRVKDSDAPIVSQDLPNQKGEIALSDSSVIKYNVIQRAHAKRFMFGKKDDLQIIQKLWKHLMENDSAHQ